MDVHVTIVIPPTLPSPKKYIGWRCLHEAEGGYDSDDSGQPEIRPALPNPKPVDFTEKLQWLSWDLNVNNELFTKNNWTSVYGDTTAFCNGNGFGNPLDPRANYVVGENEDEPNPKLMKALICGGMFIRGDAYDGLLHCVPGVHAINSNEYTPSIDEVVSKNWYFVATTQLNGKISNFPQGHGRNLYIPYVLRETVTYPLSWFVKWEEDYLPDPLKIYLTK